VVGHERRSEAGRRASGGAVHHVDADPGVSLSALPSPAGLFLYDSTYGASKLELLEPISGAIRWTQPAIMWDTTGPAVVDSHVLTLEGTSPAEPLSKVTWRSLADGQVEATSALTGNPFATVAGSHGSAIVVTDSHIAAVNDHVVWEAPMPAFSSRGPVALPDGGAAVQLTDPQRVCAATN